MSKNVNQTPTSEKAEATKRKIEIDPNILVDCIDYTNKIVDGYVAIYQNFQNILWTMKTRGVSDADAAAATVEIVNRAAAKAQEMVPHKNPFEEVESSDNSEEESK